MSVLLENYTTQKIHKSYTSEWFIFHNLTHDFLNDIISVISFQNLYFILSMSFCPCNKMNITWQLEDMNFIPLHQKQYFTYLLRLFIE